MWPAEAVLNLPTKLDGRLRLRKIRKHIMTVIREATLKKIMATASLTVNVSKSISLSKSTQRSINKSKFLQFFRPEDRKKYY